MKRHFLSAILLTVPCMTAPASAALVIAFSESPEGKVRLQMRGQIDNFNGSELLTNTPTAGFTTTYSAIMAANSFFAGYNNAGSHAYSVISMSANNYQPYVGGFYIDEAFLDGGNNVVAIPAFGFNQHSLLVDTEYELGTYLDIDVIADVNWNLRVSRPTPSQGDSATFSWDGGNQSMTFQIGALHVPEPTSVAFLGFAGVLVLARRSRGDRPRAFRP